MVTADPPFDAGVKVTARAPFSEVTEVMVGPAGTVTGIPTGHRRPGAVAGRVDGSNLDLVGGAVGQRGGAVG